ncbi:MAG: TraR/DksA C4-type zinc finger protein [Planctomycetes bacterium]|nr:TraR/DksA C4-type zinc finger protein [Planctomycetota bacterium]
MAAKKPTKKPATPATPAHSAKKSAPASGSAAPKKGAPPAKPVAGKAPAAKPMAGKAAPGKPAAAPVKKVAAKKVPERTIVPPESERKLLKSPLGRAEMNHFRELLLRKRDDLVGDLQSLHDQAFKASDQGNAANHMADFGSDNYEQDFNLGIIENEEEVVGEIDLALRRIDTGEYGVCLDCHVPVPKARLEAIPWARQCVTCKSKAERG